MSTLDNENLWSISKEKLDSKYEKCRNITEEIYKRINITFQIKKSENNTQSDISEHSDVLDSNELSNETDLFACDKTDSLPSSTENEGSTLCEKYININNNEETRSKQLLVQKRPKKRFRKRVKKRPSKPSQSDSDGSSDEALPLSRVIEVGAKCESPDNVMGVPKIIIVTKDLKPKILTPDRKSKKSPSKREVTYEIKDQTPPVEAVKEKSESKKDKPIDKGAKAIDKDGKGGNEDKSCSKCSLTFRGGRSLRRHMSTTHGVDAE